LNIRSFLNTVVENKIYIHIKQKKWFYVGIIAISISYMMFIWFNCMLNPKDSTSKAFISFEVNKGSSAKQLTCEMQNKGLIKNSFVFNLYARANKLDAKIKSGSYLLSPSMSVAEILDTLVLGDSVNNDIKVTIPEGSNLEKIASLFDKNDLVSRESFLEHAIIENFKEEYTFLKELPPEGTLEGFLFPDTYYMPKGKGPEFYIDILLNRFDQVYSRDIAPILSKDDRKLSLYEIITLASIVEAEAQLENERPIIAGVFYNRLKQGMALQSCATVEFALGEHKEVLSFKDLEVDSPYNTYVNPGLPPGPIGVPGLSSIMATIKPEETDYMYFVAKGDGSHIFNLTYSEHIKSQKEIEKANGANIK